MSAKVADPRGGNAMIRTALIAAAALTVATAADAEPKPEANGEPVVAKAAPAQRYCVVSVPTGSRLERRDCKTLDAWLATGFDPRAKK
jgi:hypothetical protein